MMGYGDMMGGFSSLGFITWLILAIDLVLLGMWLWKQVK